MNLPKRRFFVVIHALSDGLEHVLTQAQIVEEAGADGIFIIPDYVKGLRKASIDDIFYYLERLNEISEISIDANFLARHERVVPRIYDIQPSLVHSDSKSSSGIEREKLPETEFFLALAFKYSKYVNLTGLELEKHVAEVCKEADVPTTSGEATGVSASLDKISEIRSYMPRDKRLGIASGVTEDNVESYLKEGVTDFLVATSLIDRVDSGFDLLNPKKVRYMRDVIYNY